MLGDLVSGLGTQAALFALPYRSAGVGCIVCAAIVVAAFPALARYDRDEPIAALA